MAEKGEDPKLKLLQQANLLILKGLVKEKKIIKDNKFLFRGKKNVF